MPSYEQASTTLHSYIVEFAGGNKTAFERLTQCCHNTLYQWLQKKQKPQLQSWLQICFRLGIPLVDTLTLPRESSTSQSRALEKQTHINQPREKLQQVSREQLQSFLEEVLKGGRGEPPSVREVARRLGCSKERLYENYPGLTRAITAKQSDYQKVIKQKQILQERIWSSHPQKPGKVVVDWKKIREALEAILADKQSIPPSMNKVATQLGYFQSALTKKLPDLCHAISIRYLEDRRKRKEARMQMLEQQIRQVMLSLYEHGRHPGIQQVRDQLNNAWLFRDPYTKSVWRETLSELSTRDKKL